MMLSFALATPGPACDDLLTGAQARGVKEAVRAGRRVHVFAKLVDGANKILAVVGATDPGASPSELFGAFDRVAVDVDEAPRDPLLRAGAALRAWWTAGGPERPRFTRARDQFADAVIDLRRPRPRWRERVAQNAFALNVGLTALAAAVPFVAPDTLKPLAALGVAAVVVYQIAGKWFGRSARARGGKVFAHVFPLEARADDLHHADIVRQLDAVLGDSEITSVVTVLPDARVDALAARLDAAGYTPLFATTPTPAPRADLSALKITPELMELAAGDPKYRRLISAFSTIFDQLTKQNLIDLATNLIESPIATPEERRALVSNPYFLENPAARTATADLNLIVIRRTLGADLDAYALGLWSTMITPNRVSRTMTAATIKTLSPAKRLKRFRALMERAEYRAAALDLLEQGAKRPRFVEMMNASEAAVEHGVTFTAADLERVRDEIRAGKTLAPKSLNVVGSAVTAVQMDIFDTNFALGLGLDFDNVSEVRDRLLTGAKIYFKRTLPVTTPLTVLSVFIGAMLYDAPVPMHDQVLKQSIIDSAQRALLPLKAERSRAVPAAPTVVVTPPLEVKPVDTFAPPPVARRKRGPKTIAAAAAVAVPAVATIAPELDLRRLVDEQALPAFGVTYEVVFTNGPANVVQRVRFGGKAIKWMNDHPAVARAIVRTVCLGGSDDASPGIKSLRVKSRRYAGQLFELKFEADYRPFVIFEKSSQTWQILGIPHKDDQDRAARWVKPIDAA